MKNKGQFLKKSLSVILSAAMLFGYVPAMNIEAQAAPVGTEYISLPITIRDFAADGMLFEFNQAGATGTTGAAETTTFSINGFNPSYNTWISGYNTGTGIYVCTYAGITGTGPWGAGRDHLMVICNSDGSIQKVVPYGTGKGKYDETKAEMDSTDYVVWVGNAGSAYSTLSAITSANKSSYKLTYSGNTLTMSVSGAGAVYHQGDTAGFSMLSTGDADYIKNLPADESQTIAGTDLIQNGSWGLKTDPDPVEVTLNSGATQDVYGAWIRTDLVKGELGANGKPVYTEAAVTYIAEYMQQIMAVPEKNADGSYNTYHVQGAQVIGNEDLASKIRTQVKNNGNNLGTYEDAKAKFDADALNHYSQITTWYDAAYFLLHNTYNDSEGYGKTVMTTKNGEEVKVYNNVHLVSNGEGAYVFNSAYDDAVYDPKNGEIYNTQTNTITGAYAKDATEPTYVRGNLLPAARFDPYGPSGSGQDMGYRMSGDVYGDMVTDSTSDWAEYYDTTNYNLSLEGHAQFIYYEDEDLYFTFTGDDDVYLYINGIRVLDVGAAHSVSKASINLNDVAELCDLKDGQSYTFDFFYMERHGTAANFGIETNIKIVDPAMTTNKTGYQNGTSTGYNGPVDASKPVGYSYELTNNGETPIINLIFDDPAIDIYLGYDGIDIDNGYSDINEMYAIHYGADGEIIEYIKAGALKVEKLREMLADGLLEGEKIGIYGFKYQITDKNWSDGNNTFDNVVYTTATAVGENSSTSTLNGIANWKVQKQELATVPFHVYEWAGKGVTVDKDELIEPLDDENIEIDGDEEIVLCSPSGVDKGDAYGNAVLNSDDSITFTGETTGSESVYYKVLNCGYDNAVHHYDVYSYDVADNTYVLDYGLAVELNGEKFGLMVNDTLTLDQNKYGTSAAVTGISNPSSNYGTFTWDEAEASLKYTPNAIINDTDSVKATVQILENGATEVTKFTGVNMTETITTAPANVVYYEENFPGITYVNQGENQWAHYETVDEEGNSVAGTEQSADQDSNYGSDPNYAEDKVGTIVSGDSVGTVIDEFDLKLDTSNLNALQSSGIEALNRYLGLGGSDSNGTVNELVVKETAEVMFFDFVGTGFEIVGRTTQEQYAVLNVQVQKDNGDGTYTIVKQKPVITESKGGDLYQLPIISFTGLERDNYRVTVRAAGSSAAKDRILYIDGIRIYGPLDNNEALEYYNPEEYQAEFFEIKQLIKEGKMIYADITVNEDDSLQLITGTSLIEDVEGNTVLTTSEDVDEYLKVGPNNELYLEGDSTQGLIAFFLTPDEDIPEAARTLEIGAHRKADSLSDDYYKIYMAYGSKAEDIYDGTYLYEIASGTEMYYSIDVDNLIMDDNGNYLVMIGNNFGTTALSLTNLKVSGYEISFAEASLMAASEDGTLDEEPVVQEVAKVYEYRRAQMVPEEPEEEPVEVPVNENLTIDSAALKAAKVVSGRLATATVKVSGDVDHIAITDADGVEVEYYRLTSKASGSQMVYTAIWTVTGSRGDELNFNVRAYDAEGLASVNEEVLTVTIK